MEKILARPRKDEDTKKADRIIAKVYEQLYRWGFSSNCFEELISMAAYHSLGRANIKEIGNIDFSDEDDFLSVASIEKIYKVWKKRDAPYFKRINYSKTFLKDTAPKEEHLYDVIIFLMNYMNQEPEKCIFKNPPSCPDEMVRKGIWWRFYDGALDGDPVLSKKAAKRVKNSPRIKK